MNPKINNLSKINTLIESTLKKTIGRQFESLPVQVKLWNGAALSDNSESKNSCATLRVVNPLALRYFLRPTLAGLAQAYVEGDIELQGSVSQAIRAIETASKVSDSTNPKNRRRWMPRRHSRRVDSDAIEYHYDISNDFYRLLLGEKMVYSCAYFKKGRETLDEAQERKLDLVCKKLMLKPGERFLDIGCGWGALVLWAAKHYGVYATGITLSRNQYEYARQRVREEGLQGSCRILLCDYRDVRGKFHKIASVGMFEHVGIKNLSLYFKTINRLLTANGTVLNHGICSSELDQAYVGAGMAGDFIERYVFPKAELPHVSVALREMEAQALEVADVESLRPHYAKTLEHWFKRFEEKGDEVLSHLDERRFRIWRAYLAGCSYAFERGWVSVYQVLATKRSEAGAWNLPWTREHLYS